jgi:hypothetical protein
MEVTDKNGRFKVEVTSIVTEIVIGTTTVTGGVSGRVLYDNAGVVGELDLSAIYVPTSRTISTTGPLSGGGDLSADRTLSIPKATTAVDGYLSAADWTIFNGKQNALGFTPVPTTRTLTINGTTQDLSADRTFTISTGITIGTTAITSGTNGRFLFDDAGVVSETNGAFWDKVNSRWGIGTITPQSKIDIRRTNATIQFDEFTTNSATGCLWFSSTKTTSTFSIAGEGTNTLINAPTGYVGFFQALAEKAVAAHFIKKV